MPTLPFIRARSLTRFTTIPHIHSPQECKNKPGTVMWKNDKPRILKITNEGCRSRRPMNIRGRDVECLPAWELLSLVYFLTIPQYMVIE